jgi:hypothetical protein
MNLIIDNYPIGVLKPLLIPLKNTVKYTNLESKNNMYSMINSDVRLHNIMKQDIYYEKTVLEKMEKLRSIYKESPEYDRLYQEIISVGEFKL